MVPPPPPVHSHPGKTWSPEYQLTSCCLVRMGPSWSITTGYSETVYLTVRYGDRTWRTRGCSRTGPAPMASRRPNVGEPCIMHQIYACPTDREMDEDPPARKAARAMTSRKSPPRGAVQCSTGTEDQPITGNPSSGAVAASSAVRFRGW